MSIVDRIKNICLTPATEWRVIDQEPASPGGLLTAYAAPLVAIGAVAGFLGSAIFLSLLGGFGVAVGLTGAIFNFVIQLVFVSLLAVLINVFAPTFGGQKNLTQAFKLAVYSCTPVWVLGIARVVPLLGGLIVLLGGLYGIYLMYVGFGPVMKSAPDKSPIYTLAVVGTSMLVGFVLFAVVATMGVAGAIGASALTGGLGSSSSAAARSAERSEVQFDKNSTLGKLQEFGKAMEESNKKMEAAQKSGDANAAANAAMDTLGTLLGGGKKVDPLEIDQIKAFLPATLGGFARQGNGTAEKSGIAALMVSKAEAEYADGTKRVRIEISDPGGASGLVGLASWATLQTSKEDDNGSERTSKVNGRMVHEKTSRNGGTDEFDLVLGDRFVVSASSREVKLDQLKSMVAALDLNKLESMKDVGVKK
jgi:hypothetical protein